MCIALTVQAVTVDINRHGYPGHHILAEDVKRITLSPFVENAMLSIVIIVGTLNIGTRFVVTTNTTDSLLRYPSFRSSSTPNRFNLNSVMLLWVLLPLLPTSAFVAVNAVLP
eukprot:PhF_6_TR12933/c0_g1_i1/m.20410